MTVVDDDFEDAEEADLFPEAEPLDPKSQAFVDDLVEKIVLFMHELVGHELFPYQIAVARRMIESVLINDGEEISILMSRQSGKSETVADVVAALLVLLPKLATLFPNFVDEMGKPKLEKFKRGFWVGIFAPTDEQADTIFSRIVSRLTSDHAMDILLDPEIDDTPDGKGKIVKLKKSGSFCRMQTAHPRAKIESKSYHLLVVDEAQHADEHVVRKSIGPMGAFYNATRVKLGTPDVKKGDFYKVIQFNKRHQTRRGAKQNHFEYDWKVCNTPEAPIWMGDYSFKPLEKVAVGDTVIGWEISTSPQRSRRTRRLTKAMVLEIHRRIAPIYRVEMASGAVIRCTADHLWLSGKSKGATATAERIQGGLDYFVNVQEGRSLVRVIKPTPPLPQDLEWSAAWLGGVWDGEGTAYRIAQSYHANREVYDEITRMLDELGIKYTAEKEQPSPGRGRGREGGRGCGRITMRGGRQTLVDFLNWCDPVKRASSPVDHEILRTRFMADTDEIVSVEPDGEGEVISMTTSTGNYVAWGYASKNCARYNPNYKRYVTGELRRLGEDSDEFRLCLAPETKVLTADLRYISVSELTVGTRLVGFDEHQPAPGQHRKFRESVVEAVSTIKRPCYRLELDDGTTVVASAEHRWLVTTAGRRTVWKSTEDLNKPRYKNQSQPNDRIFKVADVWETQDSYAAGYLAAAFDGEGCISRTGHATMQLCFTQNDNAMLAQVEKMLGDAGYSYGISSKETGCKNLYLTGGRAALMRFLGEFRPPRLLDRLSIDGLGSIGRHDHTAQDFKHPTVLKKTFLGEQEVVAFRTSTRTFVAEGLASHNSYALEWLLERGMFVTGQVMEELSDRSMDIVKSWFKTPVLVGIDPARRIDSTVVTVVYVDWAHPDEFGYYDHRILNWLELHGDDWEIQYHRICEFLQYYDVMGVAVDSQGVGDAVAERLKHLLPRTEVHALLSTRPALSERWTHLMQLVQRRMVVWPGSARAKRTKVHQRFMHQMEELEKHYDGPHLLARAPEEAEAHDDFPSSLSLACSLTKEMTLPTVEVSNAPFYEERDRAHRYG